jgi:signal transduction histidine kinase/response regulator RpfG family c-di-GMP phosphodiesterase
MLRSFDVADDGVIGLPDQRRMRLPGTRANCFETERQEVSGMPSDPKMNILLVDDQVSNLVALEAVLDGLGQNIVKARSGAEALRCLLDNEFAMILMDVQMPEMDGFETAALIRERDRSRDTPIIFLTAYEQNDVQMFKGYSLGAVDYLFKPIVPDILRSKVMVFVDLFHKTAQVERQAEQLRENQRREHERELAEQKRRWEMDWLREEAAREKRITEALTQKAEELAQTVADRVRAEAQLRNRARQQEVVSSLGQRALAGAELPALFDEAVNHVAQTLEVEFCRTLEQSRDGRTVLLRAGYGWNLEAAGGVNDDLEAEWMTAKVLLTCEPVIIENFRTELAEARSPLLAQHGVVSGLSVIIHGAGRPFGALEAHSLSPRSFTKDDVHFLQAVANVLATAIQRKHNEDTLADVRDELAAQLSDMTLLHHLSTRLSNTRELPPMLYEVLEAMTTLQGSDQGLLCLYDRERDDLEPVASLGLGENYISSIGRLPMGVGASGAAMARRESVVVLDVETDPLFAPYREAARAAGYRSVYSTPLVTCSGKLIGTVGTCFRAPHHPSKRDTRLVELYARQAAEFIDNAQLNREIREADRRKDEFLAMLGHELRNPLAPILNALRIVRLPETTPRDAAEALEIAVRQVRHLARLVDDLLDVSRISSGKIQLRKEVVNLSRLVTRAVEIARPLIEARQHELEVSMPAEAIAIEADAARLEQVIANLLNNAAKYTEPEGRIELLVECDGDQVVLRVRDSGIGMTPEVLSRVFELFAQADRSLDRSEGGLGIGLTLVRRLVELHGGTVSAFSAGPARGSEFVARLPGCSPAIPPAVIDGGDANLSLTELDEPSHKRILVVDDNIDGARTLSRLLKAWGHDVFVAYDGPTAIETARSQQPDVVVLDIGLPGMDGYQVAQRLREQPRMTQAMLLAVTGYGRSEDLLRSREVGISHHLIKPVDPEALKKLLDATPSLSEPGASLSLP